MPESQPIYEMAPTTDRSAHKLARKHGYMGIRALARSLPEDGYVLDLGAGASPLGLEIASRRADVTVVNYDFSYSDPAILDEVSEGAPDNIQFVAGDATRLAEDFDNETFDAVFSYWLFPHLSLHENLPAHQAGVGAYNVAKPGGLLCLGPRNYDRPKNPFRGAKSIRTVKSEETDADSFAQQIVEGTALTGDKRIVQIRSNELATAVFGTTRYITTTGRRKMVVNPADRKLIPLFSMEGMSAYGKFIKAMQTEALDRQARRSN